MPKLLIAIAAAGLAGGAVVYVFGAPLTQGKAPAAAAAVAAQPPWAAAAPGRVEPKSGEIRIGAALPGRVAELMVSVNDKVEDGELLVRLDDQEARAKLAATEAEAGARRQERDAQPAVAGREDIRKSEDAFYISERAVMGARFELDGALAAKRSGRSADQNIAEARKRLADARDRLERDRIAVAVAQSKRGIPSPNRAEASLSVARAEVAIAEAQLDKTRIRAPITGTVLQLQAKLGELVAPAPDQPLIVLGDTSVMRVKAEVDEGDVAKIKIGGKAFVRSASYPGREFEGRVSSLAPSLAPPRIGQRGPRRPTDVEVLEVTVELPGSVPLLPGMRADVFFRREQ